MSYIKAKTLWCSPVVGAAAYTVYVLTAGTTFVQSKTDPAASVPAVTVPADPAATDKQLLPLTGGTIGEGTFDIYICAVDEAGNESDPLELAASVLDFTAPAAPSAGGFV